MYVVAAVSSQLSCNMYTVHLLSFSLARPIVAWKQIELPQVSQCAEEDWDLPRALMRVVLC